VCLWDKVEVKQVRHLRAQILWRGKKIYIKLNSGLAKKNEFQFSALRTSSSQIFPALSKSYSNFFYLVGRWVTWALVHWTRENEKLLAQWKNLLTPDNCSTSLLSSLNIWEGALTKEFVQTHPLFSELVAMASKVLWGSILKYTTIISSFLQLLLPAHFTQVLRE